MSYALPSRALGGSLLLPIGGPARFAVTLAFQNPTETVSSLPSTAAREARV